MTTTFNAELELSKIKPHPSNPRRKAVADDEMVESIKAVGLLQPVVVALNTAGDYTLLTGHRRADGCRKAKLKTIPAIVRTDITTDAEQVEFAVIENVHRLDLSPIEEAEAFAQLAVTLLVAALTAMTGFTALAAAVADTVDGTWTPDELDQR